MEPNELVGRKANDPADVLACMHERFFTLPPGISPYDGESSARLIPNPPSVDGGPFMEIRIARTPEAAWAGVILRRAESSEQPIWQILKDVRRYPLYRIEAPGVRIRDLSSDGRMVGGPVALRKEGEEAGVHDEDRALVTPGGGTVSPEYKREYGTSIEWHVIDESFQEPIVAVFLPDDSPHPTLRPDWPVVASVPRLEELTGDRFLGVVYVSESCMRMRDLLRLRDPAGKPIGMKFGYFLARELAHDFLSPRRKRSIRDWVTLAAALLTSAGAIAGLASRLLALFT